MRRNGILLILSLYLQVQILQENIRFLSLLLRPEPILESE
jgi:hypothetical protein